ncbi:hypothetical protein TruAng_003718 [Truncatella angustata]|nr:hypothetical protein TruAng_003718 [Truncatella angustata]
MANSNTTNPPPGGGTWATPHDWATHRATITALYEGQNMTLKKIMDTMEKDHKFIATYEEVNEIIRQQTVRAPASKPTNSSALVGSRARKTDGRRGRLPRRQPEPEPVVVKTPNHMVVSALQRLTPPPTGISCRAPSPTALANVSFLFPLTPPADLLYPEECSFHITRYTAGAFDKGIWALDSPEWLNTNRAVVDWFNRMALARGALAGGHTQQGFKLLQLCFDEYKDMIVAQDPRLMLYTTVALFLMVGYPEVIAMFVKYISNLSRILQGPFHPLHQIMASLDQMGFAGMQENARAIFDAQLSEFEKYLPPNNQVLQSMFVFAIRNLAVSGLIDIGVAEAKVRALPRDSDNGRVGMALAQVLMMAARYSEARDTIEELLATHMDRVRTIAGGLDTLFLICRLEGNDELIRDASYRRISFASKTFGAGSDWAVDACSDYEKYLRDIGDNEGADHVFSNFGVEMTELTKGVKELEIK